MDIFLVNNILSEDSTKEKKAMYIFFNHETVSIIRTEIDRYNKKS